MLGNYVFIIFSTQLIRDHLCQNYMFWSQASLTTSYDSRIFISVALSLFNK